MYSVNSPIEDNNNNYMETRDNSSLNNNINNNTKMNESENDNTNINLKNSSTNSLSHNSPQNITIGGEQNEIKNNHLADYEACADNHYNGNSEEEILSCVVSLNGNHLNDTNMSPGKNTSSKVEVKEVNNSNKNDGNFSLTNFLNRKINSIFNSNSNNNGAKGGDTNKNNNNDHVSKDGSKNEQMLQHDMQDLPQNGSYERTSNNNKDRYNKSSEKSKLVKDEYMEAKYEKEHLDREQMNSVEVSDIHTKKEKRIYDYNNGMKIQREKIYQKEEYEKNQICVGDKKRKKSSIYEENYENEMNKGFFKKIINTSPNKGNNKCKQNDLVNMKEEKEDERNRKLESMGEVDDRKQNYKHTHNHEKGALFFQESEGDGIEENENDDHVYEGDGYYYEHNGIADLDKKKVGSYQIMLNKSIGNCCDKSDSTINSDKHESYGKIDKSFHGEGNFMKSIEKKSNMERQTSSDVCQGDKID